MSIRSRVTRRGDPKESVWPSDFGIRKRFKRSYQKPANQSKAPYVIEDTMPLTKSPINGKLYFDSKKAIREHYRQHGFEEVGNEYEKGYDPGKERQREIEKRVDAKIKQNLIDRMFHGKR